MNIPHMLQKLKGYIQQALSTTQRQLCHASRNIFSKCEVCTEAGQHLKTLLWTEISHTTRGKPAVNNPILLLCLLCAKLAGTPCRTWIHDKLEMLYYNFIRHCSFNFDCNSSGVFCIMYVVESPLKVSIGEQWIWTSNWINMMRIVQIALNGGFTVILYSPQFCFSYCALHISLQSTSFSGEFIFNHVVQSSFF